MPIGSARAGVLGGGGSDIPDSVVQIVIDEGNGEGNAQDFGIQFETSQEWPDFQARFSPNTNLASDEEMVIGDTNSNDIAVVDASNNSPGDVITFSDVGLSANQTYVVFGRTPSDEGRANAFDSGITFPVTSSDGDLSMTAGWIDGPTTDFAYHIDQIGNVNL